MKLIKILVVNGNDDDFIIIKNLLANIPHNNNYILYSCDSYENAINSMLKSQYDLYLVFYHLTSHKGIELLNEAIKSNVAEPIIIINETDDYYADEDALTKGASAYLCKKKLDTYSLDRTIRYALHQQKNLQRIKESEKKFRTIFEKSPDPILITDVSGNIHDINSAGEKFFGSLRVNIMKSNVLSLYKNPSDRDVFISQIEQRGSVSNLIITLIAANNEVKTCVISSFLQISQHGDNELFHTVIHDITHFKIHFGHTQPINSA